MKKNTAICLIILEVCFMIFSLYLILGRYQDYSYSFEEALAKTLANVGVILAIITSLAFIFTLRSFKKIK